MVERELLQTVGERRSRYYLAGDELTKLRRQARAEGPPKPDDPFAIVRAQTDLTLEGLARAASSENAL